jgi:alpha-glucosidase
MKKVFILLLIVFFVVTELHAEFKFAGEIKSYKQFQNHIEFQLSNAKFNVYFVDHNVIRFRYTNQAEFSIAPSYAVIFNQSGEIKYELKEEGGKFVLSTSELFVQIRKNPCRVSIYDKQMNLINSDDESFGVSFDNDEVRCFKKLFIDEKFYGLGEKSDNLLKNGKQYTFWNTDYPGYTGKKDELYVSIPFFMGIRNYKAYGIFFDNTYKSYVNLGASNNRFYWFGAEKGEIDYYFIYGPEIKRVILDYTKLTGRIELPPLWALGYQQSKYSYYPEANVRSIAKTFRERNIPCDVIYLDIDYMDGYRVFTFDKNRFPNPAKMISDLKNDGFKIIPIIDPGVKADSNYFMAKEGLEKNLFAKYPDGIPYQGEVWPGWAYFPDFTKKETRNWWGKNISSFINLGIEGFWNDMNEPSTWGQSLPDLVRFDDNGFTSDHKKIHNVYGLSMALATREGLRKYSNKRHFILSRAGFAGIQRYAAIWTGDNIANEEHLKLACTMTQNLGLSGVPFVGSDAGGFIGEPTNDLYIRWFQLGAFTPFFRGHATNRSRAHEPFAFDVTTEEIVRQAIQLRYKLLPFWYNEFYNSSQTGLPIMRPMFLNFQEDDNCYSTASQYQFMLGDNLLIAPVLLSTDKFKKFYLPGGKWYDWNGNKSVNGGEWIVIEVPLDRIPIYIKEGGIIPMQDVQNYVGEKKIDQMELIIFPSNKSVFTLYQDDGTSYEYEKGKCTLTNFSLEKDSKSIRLHIEKMKNEFNSPVKNYLLTFLDTQKPKGILINNKSIPSADINFNETKTTLQIKIDAAADSNVLLEY